jgi:predicted nucleic acid-binding protein
LWVDYFRKRTPAALKARLDETVRTAEVVTCEPILFELLRAVSRSDARKIEEFFTTIPVLETPATLWTDAGRLGRRCAAAGFLIPAIDLLIAQICMHHDALLTTLDADFQKILAVAPLRLNLLTR